MAAWIKMPLGMEVGVFVLDEDPAPPPNNGAEPPKFSAHVCCGQTAGWIKVAVGMEVGFSFSQGVFVLDGDPAPSPKRGQSPQRADPQFFGPLVVWPNGWMFQDVTWYGGSPRPKRHCVRWGPSSPLPKKGCGAALSNFRPMSIVAKRLNGSR